MQIYLVEKDNDIIQKLEKFFPDMIKAVQINSVRKSTYAVQKEWVNIVQKSKAKKGWKPHYIKAIDVRFENAFNSEVYADENNKFVNFIEDGIKRFDMKPGILNGPKSRQGKNGRYNIIYMRKGVPGTQHMQTMAQTTYKKIQQESKKGDVKRYNTVGIGNIIQMKTKTVKKRKKTSTSKGPGGLEKIGSARHTQYGTFRVVSSKSTGWIYPGVPAQKCFSILARRGKTIATNIFKEELKKGIREGQDV